MDDLVNGPGIDVRTRSLVHHPGGSEELQLLEIKLAENKRVESHAHEQDEIMFILEGEMNFGNRRCTVGSSILIPAYTLYGFTTGPLGATFLNFRPRADYSFITKKELLERMELRRSPAREEHPNGQFR